MNQAALSLALFVIEEAIRQGPGLVSDLQGLFSSGAPTAAQFAALRAKVSAETYKELVPDSALLS